MKVFHGTIADNLPAILRDGLTVETGGENWTVSDEYVYFWSPAALQAMGEVDNEDDARKEAKRRAFDSASFGLGFAKDCRAVVLEIEIDATDIEDDGSCPNMEGAVRSPYTVPPSAIVSIEISADLSLLKGYFLTFCLDRDMSARELSDIEEEVARAMQKAEFYPEVENFLDWQPFPLDGRI